MKYGFLLKNAITQVGFLIEPQEGKELKAGRFFIAAEKNRTRNNISQFKLTAK